MGQVRSLLPRSKIEPFVFTSNRTVNGVVIAAAARPGACKATSSTVIRTIRAAAARRTPTSRG